jgi:hypothetical protein
MRLIIRAAANRFSLRPTITVISTNAAHSPIVSSEAEKSASLPKQPLSHCPAFAVALVFVVGFEIRAVPSV